MQNLKLAIRTLAKSPFVTIVAVLSLALGVGANAAIFSVLDEMLLEPLAVPQPSRLVNLSAPGPRLGQKSCNQAGDCDAVFSYPMFRDLERAQTTLAGLAAHCSFDLNVAMAGQAPLSGQGMYVSGSYFPVLGLRPALGRLFTPADDRAVGANYVVVLDHAYWETHLGSDPHVLDRAISVNGKALTIVGVAPKDFHGTTLGTRPSVYVPITMRGVLEEGFPAFEGLRTFDWVYLFARLAPGESIEQASNAINGVFRPILREVEAPLAKGVSDNTLAQFKAKRIQLSDGRSGQSLVRVNARTPLMLLFAITAFVLLIACANIANLLLARSAARQMEMAVRLSLGATRGQLLGQLLTEAGLLALLGGLGSIPVAHLTIAGIMTLLPPIALATIDFHLSLAAIGFALAVSLATTLVFGLTPSIQSTRPEVVTALRANASRLSGGRAAARFRHALVTAQIALSIALLTSAGLFVKSLHNVSLVDLGFQADNLVTFRIAPRLSGYDSTQSAALVARIRDALGAMPGVHGVTDAVVPVLEGSNWTRDMSVEGFRKLPDTDDGSSYNAVGPRYFEVMGVPLRAGREFTAGDNALSQRVAIVNETFARKFNLGRDAVGKRLSIDNDSLNIEIVGLASDSKYAGVTQVIPPIVFRPTSQVRQPAEINFYVRANLATAQTVRGIRSIMRDLDPRLPLDDVETLPQIARESAFLERMMSTTSASFAALATLLAAIGLYGVLAYSVAQRTREIGVRMALGADRATVRRMVLVQVARMTAIGGSIGLAGAFVLGRAAAALLYHLDGNDPVVFAAATLLLTLVALVAGLLPAIRASRIDPMQALRYD